MERIVRNRSATLLKTFYADGVPADPTGSPTVTVTRQSDGTTVTAGAITNEPATGTWSVTIPATSNTLLDTLTVDWSATVNGIPQEYVDTVEVAGDVLFTVADARAVKPLDNATDYPTPAILAMRTLVEESLEDVCGVAFVPRYRRTTLNGDGGTTVMLDRPMVRAIRTVTIDGTTINPSDVAVTPTGVLYHAGRWAKGTSNITVTYEHGHPYPPARVAHAALRLAKRWLVEGPVDDRATAMSNEEGTFQLVTPGMRGAMFDLPEVNAVVQQYSLAVMVA